MNNDADAMPSMSEAELVRVLGFYALGEINALCRVERGHVNENWTVETDRGCYFLKRRAPNLRRPHVIRAQHALVGGLDQAGFPVPALVPTIGDETLLVLDDECYEVQEYVQGTLCDHRRPAHLRAAAATLGRYHDLVEGLAPAALHQGNLYSPAFLRANLADLTQAWGLDRDPALAPIVQQLTVHADTLRDRFRGHGTLPHLVIHGDYYAENLLFDGDRLVGVVDWDKARWQPRVVELAEALIYFASPRPGHLKHLVYPGVLEPEPFAYFLQAYARIVTLNQDEWHVLPDYIRCIWLQISLQRLLERDPRPGWRQAREALREVLELASVRIDEYTN